MFPTYSADLGRAVCGKPEASDMLQHRGEPTRTCDSFEEAKIAAFELLAERAEHGQAPRGDALVRCPADKVPANPLRRFKKRCAAKMLQNLGAAAVALEGSLRKISCPPAPPDVETQTDLAEEFGIAQIHPGPRKPANMPITAKLSATAPR